MEVVSDFTKKDEELNSACRADFVALNTKRDGRVGTLLEEALKVRTEDHSLVEA